MHKTESEQQRDFMDICGLKRFSLEELVIQGRLRDADVRSAISLAKRLIMEEVTHELFGALDKLHTLYSERNSIETRLQILTEIADGIIDGKYVLDQLGNTLGLPLPLLFNEVQRTNMAKAQNIDGVIKIVRRADGKILKPDGWTPPNIRLILEKELERRD